MVVAVGASDADSQQTLAQVLCQLLRLERGSKIVCRSIQKRISRRGDNIAANSAPWLIITDRIVEIAVERPHALVFERPAIHPEEVAPLIGPEVDEIGA